MQAKRSLERAIRLFKRTREPRFETEEEVIQATTDDITAFFIEAYHVKDYVKREDPSVLAPGLDAKVVGAAAEALFHPKEGNPTFAMAFCHDLCNATKHGELKRPKTHITRVTGFKVSLAHQAPMGITLLDPCENLAVTVYETELGDRYADDVMLDVVRTWIEFVKKYYAPGMAATFEAQMAGAWEKPPLLAQTQAAMIRARRAGRNPTRPLPLATGVPPDSLARLAYRQNLPELPIPQVPHGGDGKVYHVEAVEVILTDAEAGSKAGLKGEVLDDQMALPAVRVLERDSLMRYRLPIEYAEEAFNVVALAHALGNPFPLDAEFGRLEGRAEMGGYYMQLR